MAVIKIRGLVNRSPTCFDDQYVTEFDAGRDGTDPSTGAPMSCHLRTTPEREQALDLSLRAAWELWRAVDPRKPRREDGKPNRPMTAFSVEIIK